MMKNSTKLFETRTLFASDEKYSNYRIPGMTVTARGTLLVYCEARQTASDWAMMDILLWRSEDHGTTFSEPTVLASGTQNHPTVNNPVMMQDQNGRIHLLYCEDYTVGGRALHRYSDDDGISWCEPIDVTQYTAPESHNAFAFGPGHGTVCKNGTLLVPVWMVPKRFNAPKSSHTPSVLSTFYSKDNGETWQLGDFFETNSEIICPNETVAALTSDGRVYLNIRHQGFCRAKAYSENGYSGWSEYAPDYSLPDPRCFGSVAAYNDGKNPYSLIFVNCNGNKHRKNVCVRASTDDGRTFPIIKTVDAERGGYCEVAVDNASGLIYILYEDKYGESDHFVRMNYAWLTDGN